MKSPINVFLLYLYPYRSLSALYSYILNCSREEKEGKSGFRFNFIGYLWKF